MAIHSHTLAQALKAEGLLPANCNLVEVLIPANGAMTIRYTVFVEIPDLPKVARAMLIAAEPTPKDPN